MEKSSKSATQAVAQVLQTISGKLSENLDSRSLEQRLQQIETVVEQSFDKVTSHPAFLGTVSVMLNANSYRKIWTRKTLEAIWRDLEIPVRNDQAQLMTQVEELLVRTKRIELELEKARKGQTDKNHPSQGQKNDSHSEPVYVAKTANVKRPKAGLSSLEVQ